jgi:hypothetical protein
VSESFRKKCARSAVALFAAVFLLAAPRLDAYQMPLDAKAVHDAYVLGQRNDQSTGDFLVPYLKQMTESRSDVHVAEIEILTPFAQVVDDSRKNSAGYTEAQAAQKYQQVGNTILVNLTLTLPSAYPQVAPAAADGAPASVPAKADDAKSAADAQDKSNLRPENFWQQFQFYFKQNGKKIPSKALHDKPIYSSATKGTPAVLDGAAIELEFDAKDVGSQETEIEVVTPDGKTISATFDLKKLR